MMAPAVGREFQRRRIAPVEMAQAALLFLALSSFADRATAAGKVYRCVTPDGHVSLLSEPCPAGSTTTKETTVDVPKRAAAQTAPNMNRENLKPFCAKRHADSYSLQAACMRNAEHGFTELQQALATHAADSPVARAAVACSARYYMKEFSAIDWALAAACLRNERRGMAEMSR